MRLIYSNAQRVLAWLGPGTDDGQEAIAISSIRRISDFLCTRLGVSVIDLRSLSNIYQDLVLKNRKNLPLPNHLDFITDGMWKSLIWLYSHQYFTRVWVVQEISANHERLVHCGREKIEWELVDSVAGYIIMEPAFSSKFGFSDTNCWWVSTITEMARNPRNWLSILYLASTYSCMDPRDVIYGLSGLIEVPSGIGLLDPDYNKPVLEVYRDSVEVSLLTFHSTDVFTYVTGTTTPSWIPRWNESMLFRNPFRFGRSLPWEPAGTTTPIWNIEKGTNILSLTGFRVDSARFSEPYNEGFFSNAMIDSNMCKSLLRPAWQRILATIEKSQSQRPIAGTALSAVATSFSFGLDENTDPADETYLMRNFIAYLKLVLHEDTFGKCIPQDLAEEGRHGDGHLFGKPAWDFKYPESSFFITNEGLFGCSISDVQPGDQLCVALGSTYPMILRPNGEEFIMRGYTYVHGLMNGERQDLERRVFRIH